MLLQFKLYIRSCDTYLFKLDYSITCDVSKLNECDFTFLLIEGKFESTIRGAVSKTIKKLDILKEIKSFSLHTVIMPEV